MTVLLGVALGMLTMYFYQNMKLKGEYEGYLRKIQLLHNGTTELLSKYDERIAKCETAVMGRMK